jgi:N-acyl-D-amino-acid deacylase
MKSISVFILSFLLFISCEYEKYDLLIKNGRVIDGTGSSGYEADVAIKEGKIVAIAENLSAKAKVEINVKDQVIAPGFIDILSWACGPILYDGRVPSVVHQGITTAIFGEGWSMGPVNDNVRKGMAGFWPEYNIRYDWETLSDYLRFVETRGTSVNVASFVGATTLRMYVIGFADRKATPDEMQQMKELLEREMKAGALGLASSLVYTPAFYADTQELIALSKTAAQFGGIYISHIRNESADLMKALKELVTISETAQIPAEIYHFKAAGRENWPKLDEAIAFIESARVRGLDISADIYPYTAGATRLSSVIPPWAKEGGDAAMIERLNNPRLRAKIRDEILSSKEGWENFYLMSGGGENILVSYLSDKRKNLQGKNIAEIAQIQQKDELSTLFDLLIEENGAGGGIYFLMSEENVHKKLRLPWVSFCTDEDAYQPSGLMGKRNPHPRAYGTFPRILGKYVREEQVLSLEQAVRKMTSLPAQRLGILNRGLLKAGMAADIVIFDPDTVIDKATYVNPHQFPEGINHVIVNGNVVVQNGEHTGAMPGKAIFKNIN